MMNSQPTEKDDTEALHDLVQELNLLKETDPKAYAQLLNVISDFIETASKQR